MRKTEVGLKNLDKFAYDLVCDWPKIIDFDPFYNGIDYSQIIRFYLWDKIGRALRIKHDIDLGEESVYKNEYTLFSQYHTPLKSYGKFKRGIFNTNKIIFIPFLAPHTNTLIKTLKRRKRITVISKQVSKQLSNKNCIKAIDFKTNLEWSNVLFLAVIEAFKKKEVTLLQIDVELLADQIKGVVGISDLAEKEIKTNKPDALYVHSDNHPPYINYVLAAKKLGVPTFTYQHGLDCEHYYLNDCYADFVAVWSNYRKNRYEKYSRFKPKKIKPIGNIFLSKSQKVVVKKSIKNIVLLTRPHRPIKCYSPSRHYLEGKVILDAILEFLKDKEDLCLLIKLHPMDYVAGYETSIAKAGLEKRVFISNESIEELLPKADLVITEDSTAGAEAMYIKRPCIHAHFANSKPVLPFVQYNAALGARTKQELVDNLNKALNLTTKEMDLMMQGQQHFAKDLIPFGNVDDLVAFMIKNIA